MLLQGNCNIKYKKRAFRLVILMIILGVILGEFAVLSFGKAGLFTIDLRGIIKNFLVFKKECVFQSDGYKKWDCMSPYFKEFVYKTSTAEAMAEAIKFKETRVVADCHLFGHSIGETALEKYNFDAGKAFSSCTRGCSDGCFHGVMERYLRNEPDPYNAISEMKSICDSVGSSWLLKRQCTHGVGHGLRAHGFLPLQDAFTACEVFDPVWVPHCKGALIMEHVDQYLLFDLDEDDMREVIPGICAQIESVEPTLVGECLDGLALGLLYYTGYDLRRSEELCEELPNPLHTATCKEHISSNIANERPSIIKGF